MNCELSCRDLCGGGSKRGWRIRASLCCGHANAKAYFKRGVQSLPLPSDILCASSIDLLGNALNETAKITHLPRPARNAIHSTAHSVLTTQAHTCQHHHGDAHA